MSSNLSGRPAGPVEEPQKFAGAGGQIFKNRGDEESSVDVVRTACIRVAHCHDRLALSAGMVDRQVVCHGVDPPWPDGRPGPLAPVLPKTPERLLHDVLGRTAVVRVTVREAKKTPAMGGHPLAEPVFVGRREPPPSQNITAGGGHPIAIAVRYSKAKA